CSRFAESSPSRSTSPASTPARCRPTRPRGGAATRRDSRGSTNSRSGSPPRSAPSALLERREKKQPMTDDTTIDLEGIRERLPHRYPFLLIDRVRSVTPGKSIVALKNVTANEEFFQGHFPGHAVMPGVLVIEALAQSAGVLAWESATEEER